MSSENDQNKNSENPEKQQKNNELVISSKKYSTLVDFREDFYENKEELLQRKSEEELKNKENEEQAKQNLLNHWSKLLLKDPPKRRTCHTSFMYDGAFYVIGGIDITEMKQDDVYKVRLRQSEKNSQEQNNNPDSQEEMKIDNKEEETIGLWTKKDENVEKMGKIAYHAGDIVNGFYYIVGGQDENLNILNSIQEFDISNDRMGDKKTNIEVKTNLQISDIQKKEFMKKILHILRAKVKDKIDSEFINVLETDLEKELLKYLVDEDLIAREKALLEEIEKEIKTEDINKLTDSSIDIEKTSPEDLDKTFRPEFITESIQKIDEKLLKIYFPPLESHTVNASNELLYIYGGMSKKDYNRHVYTYDTQNNEAKNLTENIEIDKLPPPRQDHAAVIYNGGLYVYGGIGPDNKIYDDMWRFDLAGNTWEEIKTEGQIKKEENRKKRLENKQNNGEEIDTADEEDDDLDEDKDTPDIRPKGRSGHSMVVVGDCFYIFGGKTGLIKESNEIWQFLPDQKAYECVHETLLEQFTKEELQKISSENKREVSKFRWLTRSEIEKRTNPSFNDNKNDEKDKKKKKNTKNAKAQSPNKNAKNSKNTNAKNTKNQKSKKTDKNDNKNGLNKDIEGKYSDQVLCRPNVVKMRKTLIFTSDPDKIKEGLNTLSKDEKEKITQDITSIKGELPEPRDGQSVCVDGTKLYIFGGDRFKFPFNDLFVLETNQIPKLKMKENIIKRIEKEKEQEERRLREEREKKEKEEEEKMKKAQQENIEGIQDDEKKRGDEDKGEDEGKGKDEGKREDENKGEQGGKSDDKQGNKDEAKKETKKDEDNIKKEEELKLLRELLQY